MHPKLIDEEIITSMQGDASSEDESDDENIVGEPMFTKAQKLQDIQVVLSKLDVFDPTDNAIFQRLGQPNMPPTKTHQRTLDSWLR